MKRTNSDGIRMNNGYIYSFDLDRVNIVKIHIQYISYILRCKRCCHVFDIEKDKSNKSKYFMSCPMCSNSFLKFAEIDHGWIGSKAHKRYIEQNDL